MLLLAAGVSHAQSQSPAKDPPNPLRQALAVAGFAAALDAPGAPEKSRALTSSAFGYDANSFICACYFEDELKGYVLGPLHLFRFARDPNAWTQLTMAAVGSVLSVQLSASTVLVRTHVSPSAGRILVFDDSFNLLTTLDGFSPAIAPDGSVWFVGNMMHFAPTHPEVLHFYDRRSGETREIFPAGVESQMVRDATAALQPAMALLPREAAAEMRRSVYGPPQDLDRSILDFAVSADAGTVAFAVAYDNRALDGMLDLALGQRAPAPGDRRFRLVTLVTCVRAGGGWPCRERRLADAARELGIALGDETDVESWTTARKNVVAAALRRR